MINDLTPNLDECRLLIFKIIEQAVRDYFGLSKSNIPIEQEYYQTACEFLFDNNYFISYGDTEQNLESLLQILNIDLQWFREKIVNSKDKKITFLKQKQKNMENLDE